MFNKKEYMYNQGKTYEYSDFNDSKFIKKELDINNEKYMLIFVVPEYPSIIPEEQEYNKINKDDLITFYNYINENENKINDDNELYKIVNNQCELDLEYLKKNNQNNIIEIFK